MTSAILSLLATVLATINVIAAIVYSFQGNFDKATFFLVFAVLIHVIELSGGP